MDPRQSKSDLRQAISSRLQRMKPSERAAESRSLCKRILQLLPKDPSTICAFFPMDDEVDIRTLLTDIPARGHSLYLPRKEGRHFVFRKMENVDALKPDEFGIPAPADDSPLLEPDDLTVALIPGRAYDRNGNRMGRGNGGYDIWIRSQRAILSSSRGTARTQFWGICFECQVVQNIPMETHDEKVDAIVTARGMEKPNIGVQTN